MAQKILIADDSTTIQKVIKITLASCPYELIEAINEKELMEKLADDLNLVLIDFNLSDTKNGCELIKIIKAKVPNAAVIALLGTFDNIDDKKLDLAGADDKIIKPFESATFINKCKFLIDNTEKVISPTNEEVEIARPEVIDLQTEDIKIEGIELSPIDQVDEHEDNIDFEEMKRPSDAEASNWAVEVPDVIGGATPDYGLMPPVIFEDGQNENVDTSFLVEIESESTPVPKKRELDLDSTSTFNLDELIEVKKQATPAEEDLEYPELVTPVILKEDQSEQMTPIEGKEIHAKLVSLDELAPEEEEVEINNNDDTDPAFNLTHLELEKEIASDASPEEFWAVDQDQGLNKGEELSFSTNEPELIVEEKIVKEQIKPQVVAAEIDYGMIMQNLRPMLENLVKQYCKDSVEKVAWEVIPDLAENLIKRELQDLARGLDNK